MVGSRKLLHLGWYGERLPQKGKNLDTAAAAALKRRRHSPIRILQETVNRTALLYPLT